MLSDFSHASSIGVNQRGGKCSSERHLQDFFFLTAPVCACVCVCHGVCFHKRSLTGWRRLASLHGGSCDQTRR